MIIQIIYKFGLGLRTLCLGVVDIDEETYQDWSEKYYTASTALEDREKKVDAASELIERNMNLLGATAIEDKLQVGGKDKQIFICSLLLDAHIQLKESLRCLNNPSRAIHANLFKIYSQ